MGIVVFQELIGEGASEFALPFEDEVDLFELVCPFGDGCVDAFAVSFTVSKVWVLEEHFPMGAGLDVFTSLGVGAEGLKDFAVFRVCRFGLFVGAEASVLGEVKEGGGPFKRF